MVGMVRGAVVAAILVVAPAAAHAAPDYVGGTPPVVAGNELVRPVADPVVLGQEIDSDRIPITGGDIAGLTVLGVALATTGVLLTRRARRALAAVVRVPST